MDFMARFPRIQPHRFLSPEQLARKADSSKILTKENIFNAYRFHDKLQGSYEALVV